MQADQHTDMDTKGFVMKGFVKERASPMTKYPRWNRVNVMAWARETMESEKCQSVIDTKVFKGRGTAQVLRQLVSDVDTVESEMVDLSTATKKVPGAVIYLAEHRRTEDGYMALRWRGTSTRKHLSWDEAHAYYSALPTTVRQWYEQADAQARGLNAKHLKLRKVARELRQSVQRREPQLFAKPIPSACKPSH